MPAVSYETQDEFAIVSIDRPEVRNAVDRDTAEALVAAFREFESDPDLKVGILTGAGGTFCAGADLKAISEGRTPNITEEGDGPMGPTRMLLDKPVIAAVEGTRLRVGSSWRSGAIFGSLRATLPSASTAGASAFR